MLPTNELNLIRADILATLPDTCNILTPTNVSDGQGGWTTTWGTATAGVACRLDAMDGKQLITGGAVQPYQQYVLTLPYNATLPANARIELGSLYYTVISVNKSQSVNALKRAIVEAL